MLAEALICNCHNVSKGAICEAITTQGLVDVGSVKKCTKAGTGCGSCATLVADAYGKALRTVKSCVGVTVFEPLRTDKA